MNHAAFEELREAERSFAARTIRRAPLFRRISNANVAVALAMAILEKLTGRG